MDAFLNGLGIALIVIVVVGILLLTLYLLALCDIFLGTVPEGEIVVVVVSDKAKRFIGNITGHWVHPVTGQVHLNSDPVTCSLPVNLFGLGIYWFGIWPFADRYRYSFPRNKYIKKPNSTEYDFEPRDDEADSVYFQASYPICIDAQTIEFVPILVNVLITTETTNVDTTLFKVKSPGWLAAVTAAVKSAGRDFIGNKTLDDINKLKAEAPNGHSPAAGTANSEFQEAILLLNSDVGNPSLATLYGQKIVSVNFLGYKIGNATTPAHTAAMAAFTKSKEAEAAKGEGERIKTLKAAEAEGIKKVGAAEAEAAQLMTAAVKDNPHAGTIALAEAIKEQTHATTLIIGDSVMPTKVI